MFNVLFGYVLFFQGLVHDTMALVQSAVLQD